jgi:hypothetical protein
MRCCCVVRSENAVMQQDGPEVKVYLLGGFVKCAYGCVKWYGIG